MSSFNLLKRELGTIKAHAKCDRTLREPAGSLLRLGLPQMEMV